MKKTIAAIACLVMFAASASTVQASNKEKENSQDHNTRSIFYEVHVNMANEVDICETYWIQVVSGNGELVAAPQIYVQGVSTYMFQERVSGEVNGVRIANLTKAAAEGPPFCNISMWARPDIRYGTFMVGYTYQFDLTPFVGKIRHFTGQKYH